MDSESKMEKSWITETRGWAEKNGDGENLWGALSGRRAKWNKNWAGESGARSKECGGNIKKKVVRRGIENNKLLQR